VVRFLQRFDVLESGFRVRLRGTNPADLCPVDEVLEPELVAQVEPAVSAHDFTSCPVATGLLGSDHVWSLTPVAGEFCAVTVKRSIFPRRVDALARRNRLSDSERAHLRYAAGGTDVAVAARSLGIDAESAKRARRALLDRLGVNSVGALIELAGTTAPRTDVRKTRDCANIVGSGRRRRA
jgi:hypothetical protein